MRIYADVVERLQGSRLTDAAWINCQNLRAKLIHVMNDMTGQLPTRSVIEVESAPTLHHIVEGWSPSDWHKNLGEAAPVDHPAEDSGRTPVPSPTPKPERPTTPAGTPEPRSPSSPLRVERDRGYSSERDHGSDSLDPTSVPGTPEHRAFMRFLSS
jgi:hypothetical protein